MTQMPARYLDEKIAIISSRWDPLAHQSASSGTILLVEATLGRLHEIRDAAQAVVDEIDRWTEHARFEGAPCI